MKTLGIEITGSESEGDVVATCKTLHATYEIQLTEGEYRPSLGCLIFKNTDTTSGEFESDDEEENAFVGKLIELAEEEFRRRNEYADESIFGVALNDCSYYLRKYVDQAQGVDLVVASHTSDDYSPSYSVLESFSNMAEARDFVGRFETGAFFDVEGLLAMLEYLHTNKN